MHEKVYAAPEQEQVPWRRGKERPGALLAKEHASSGICIISYDAAKIQYPVLRI